MHVRSRGFTIVELLIVIIVIGILATITVVAYTGVRDRSIRSSIQLSVQQAGKKLGAFSIENGERYPDSLAEVGIVNSDVIVYDYVFDNNASPRQYCVQATSRGITYYIGYSSEVGIWTEKPSEGQCRDAWMAHAKVVAVSAGYSFRCILNPSGDAFCSGSNAAGELGNGTTTSSAEFVPVDMSGALAGKKFKTIEVGGDGGSANQHVCGIATDNKVYCWGSNSGGLLGNNSTVNSPIPVAVDTSGALSGKTIKSLSVGYNHNCVIASDDNGYCWGGRTVYNKGQLGNGTSTQSLVPVAVLTSGALLGKTLKVITATSLSTCALASDNKAYCWGGFSGLGRSGTTNFQAPVAVNTDDVLNGKDLKYITFGGSAACVLSTEEKVYCWGESYLGDGTANFSYLPVAVSMGGRSAKKLYAATSNAYGESLCYATQEKNIYCWNKTGKSSSESNFQWATPTEISYPAGTTIERFAIVGNTLEIAYGIASNGKLYRWADYLSTPTEVSLPW